MAFNIPNQTSYIKQRPVSPATAWTRQPDWITITDTPGEVQFLTSNLVGSAYTITTTFTRTLGTQNIYIDWGDGTIDTISTIAATETSHTYTTPGTPCSLGYDTYKVRVYGDAGTRITRSQLGHISSLAIPCGILEAYYGDDTIITAINLFSNNFSGSVARFPILEYVKLPSVMFGGGANTFNISFMLCYSLAKVVMPISCSDATDLYRTFYGCYNLEEIIFPQDAVLLSRWEETFDSCFVLRSVILPPTLNNAYTFGLAFNGCRNLTSIILPPLPLCTTYTSAFQSCNSLITIEIPSFTSGATTINASNMFNNCSSLEYIKMPTSVVDGSVFNTSNMFSTCGNLKSIILPNNFRSNFAPAMFQNCYSLSTVVGLNIDMPGLANMNTMFSGCFALQEIELPTSVYPTVSMANTFTNCNSISKITIPSTYNITTLASAFNACRTLNELILPNNAQNSLTSMNSMCNFCSNLKSVVMPTSLNACTSLTGVFANCSALQSVIFPSTMNACTDASQVFNGCYNLESFVFPTSMSSNTAFFLTFNACVKLQSITLPATTGNITNYNSVFRDCYSLETLTLPTSPQSTALTTLNLAFSNTYKLKTINNVDKLGNPSTSSTIYVDGTGLLYQNQVLTSLDFYTKFSKFEAYGNSASPLLYSKLNSLRLRNNGAGQYAGTSPQINISYTDLGQAALVQVFNDLPTITSKTINITGATGAAALTAPERAIATGKGWTIIG